MHKLKSHSKLNSETMFDFISSSMLFLTLLRSSVGSVSLSCYSNAGLTLASDGLLYNHTTLNSCRCLGTQQAFSGFQYDHSTNSCYVLGSNSSTSDMRVNSNSQVCFINRLSTVGSSLLFATIEINLYRSQTLLMRQFPPSRMHQQQHLLPNRLRLSTTYGHR